MIVELSDDVIQRGIRMAEVERKVMVQIVRAGGAIQKTGIKYDRYGANEILECIQRLVTRAKIRIVEREIAGEQVQFLEMLKPVDLSEIEDRYRAIISMGRLHLTEQKVIRRTLLAYFQRNPWWSTVAMVVSRRRLRRNRDEVVTMLHELVAGGSLVTCEHMDADSGYVVPHYRSSAYAVDGRLPKDKLKPPVLSIDLEKGASHKTNRIKLRIVELLALGGGQMKRGYLRQGLGGGTRHTEQLEVALSHLHAEGVIAMSDEKNPISGRWYTMISLVESLKRHEETAPGADNSKG